MKHASRRPKRISALAALALTTLLAAAALVPGTHSAFTAKVINSSSSVASNPYFSCSSVFTAYSQSSTYFEYPLNDASNSTYAADDSGTTARRGTYRGTMTSTTATPLACNTASGGAYTLDGTSSYISTPTSTTSPTAFTIAVWFKTTAKQGLLVGFANTQTGTSAEYDRLLYIDADGNLEFGTYNNQIQAVSSPLTYTDGLWHNAIATFSASTGTALYVDGALVASDPTYTTAVSYTGYWRIGYGTLTGAPDVPSSFYFKGSLRYAAVFRTALTAAEAKAQYVAGK